MTTTVAAIANQAFTAVSARVTGVIHDVVLSRTALGAYNTTTNTQSETVTTSSGQAIKDQTKAAADSFPHLVAGPSSEIWLVRGLTFKPEIGDQITIKGKEKDIIAVSDILEAGELFYIVAGSAHG